MLTVTPHVTCGTARLALDGELDMSTAYRLDQAVDGVIHADRVEVDCLALRFCDSSGIAALMRAHHVATGAGTPLHLINVAGLVHHVLQVCGVLNHLVEAPQPE